MSAAAAAPPPVRRRLFEPIRDESARDEVCQAFRPKSALRPQRG